MPRFQHVLISVVGDHTEPAALAQAAGLARRTGASLKPLDVAEDLPWYARLVRPRFDEVREIGVRQKTWIALYALALTIFIAMEIHKWTWAIRVSCSDRHDRRKAPARRSKAPATRTRS